MLNLNMNDVATATSAGQSVNVLKNTEALNNFTKSIKKSFSITRFTIFPTSHDTFLCGTHWYVRLVRKDNPKSFYAPKT